MDKLKAFHYLERAECFLRLMKLGTDRDFIEVYLEQKLTDYEAGTALLAVHAGIAASDAVLVHLTGNRSNAQNHKEAVGMLREACGKNGLDAHGVSHFAWLVSHKDDIAYGDRRVSSTDIQSARLHAERFIAWVYHVIPEFSITERP